MNIPSSARASPQSIVLIAAGGHCRSCIDVIEQSGKYTIAGILDRRDNLGSSVVGYEIIGTDEKIPHLIDSGCVDFHVALGQVGRNDRRRQLFDEVLGRGGRLPVLASPRSYIAPTASVGAGSIIMHDALVNAGAVIGSNCIINTRALIEHDAAVGDHCHIATGAIINGGSVVGEGSFVGSGAIVFQGVDVEAGSVVAAGEIVRRDVRADRAPREARN